MSDSQPNPRSHPLDGTDDPQEAAALYVQETAEGHDPQLDDWASRLSDDENRASFRRMVGDAQAVTSLLPRQVGPGVVLGGRYRIEHEIGVGGMGKVFHATDLHLGRAVAVKVLAAMGRSDFDPLELFRKESRLLASLRHPNIVAIHEAATDGDISYLVMDLIRGETIADVLESVREGVEPDKRGRRPAPHDGLALAKALGASATDSRTNLVDERSWWRTVARIMVDVADTLDSTHGKGVIHRDLKPSNILLRQDGTPVVLDFGLAGFLDGGDGAVTQGFVGSAAYLAPEQVQRRAVGSDPRSDIYQLGLLLYELLTLVRAFPGESIGELLPLISSGKFLRPRELDSSIPSELEAICLKAMELEPGRRYASARHLLEDLERYLGGQELPLAARGGNAADMARRARYFARRHRGRLLAAVAGLLIIATAVIAAELGDDAGGMQIFEPYRYDAETWKPIAVGHGDSASLNEVIGVLVKNERPLYLYVLSVFGQANPPDWIVPMEPQAVIQDIEGTEWTPTPDALEDQWALRIDPREGGTHVACARIEELSADIPYEGLWVIASPEPQPHLASWMSALRRDSLFSDDGSEAITYTRAHELFAAVERGSSPNLSATERAKLLSHLDADGVFSEEWPFNHSQRFTFFFKMDQALAGTASDG